MQTIYLPARNTVLTKMTWQKSSPITQTICLQIHKQGSLIRHLSFFLKPGGSQPTLANFLPPSTENLQNFRRQGKKKGNVSWPSCLLTKTCSSLSWELRYVYSVLSATPTPSLGHENQTGQCLCEPKVPMVYRFLNHHRRRQLCSGLGSSGPELQTQGRWQGHMTRLRPCSYSSAQHSARVTQNLAHQFSLQHSPQLHKKHKYHRRHRSQKRALNFCKIR